MKENENIENYETSLSMAENKYKLDINRFNSVDSKLNMLLVLLASFLVVSLQLFFSNESNSQFGDVVKYILIGLIFISILVVVLGIMPKDFMDFGPKTFSYKELLNSSRKKYVVQYLEWYEKIISEIEKSVDKKLKIMNITKYFISVIIVVFFSMVIWG